MLTAAPKHYQQSPLLYSPGIVGDKKFDSRLREALGLQYPRHVSRKHAYAVYFALDGRESDSSVITPAHEV